MGPHLQNLYLFNQNTFFCNCLPVRLGNVYTRISIFSSGKKLLPFSHWQIPTSCGGPHRKFERATCGPLTTGCLPCIIYLSGPCRWTWLQGRKDSVTVRATSTVFSIEHNPKSVFLKWGKHFQWSRFIQNTGTTFIGCFCFIFFNTDTTILYAFTTPLEFLYGRDSNETWNKITER
jgi:hypothetical protein